MIDKISQYVDFVMLELGREFNAGMISRPTFDPASIPRHTIDIVMISNSNGIITSLAIALTNSVGS